MSPLFLKSDACNTHIRRPCNYSNFSNHTVTTAIVTAHRRTTEQKTARKIHWLSVSNWGIDDDMVYCMYIPGITHFLGLDPAWSSA